MKEMGEKAEEYMDMVMPFDMNQMAYGGFQGVVEGQALEARENNRERGSATNTGGSKNQPDRPDLWLECPHSP